MISIKILRQPKIFNMALFDWTLTFIGAYIIYNILYRNKYINQTIINLTIIFVCTVIIGVFVHYILNIPTMFNYYLGLNSLKSVLNNR